MDRETAASRVRAALWTGGAVLAFAVFYIASVWFGSALAARVAAGGTLPGAAWAGIDFAFPLVMLSFEIGFLLFGVAACAAWRVAARRAEIAASHPAAARASIAAGLIWSAGALACAAGAVPNALGRAFRAGMCGTTTFERSVSPNGLYVASVVEVDCGAVSSFNRQVLVASRIVPWTELSVFYFNEQPSLKLSWSGRNLLIEGDRDPKDMAHPPADPMLYAGVLAHYSYRAK